MKRKRVFNGKLIKVSTLFKKIPNGKMCYLEEVKHPGASLIVPVFGKKIVLLRQYRAVIDKYIWELPAGVMKKGESPLKCAKREITEETGYEVKDVKKIGMIYTTPGFCDEVIHVFKARCVSKGIHERDEDEIIKVRLFNGAEIKEMVKSGRIMDSKTVTSLALAGII